MVKIKAIIFDVGGVLKTPHKVNDQSIHSKVARKLKIDLDSLFDAIDTPYAKSIIGDIPESTFIRVISNKLSISGKTLTNIYIDTIRKHFKTNKELFELAKNLKKKGYIVGVLSDQWYFSKRALMPKSEFKFFNPQIISCETNGIRKPESEIYKLLLRKLKKINKSVKPEEVLFIDNRKYNLDPAKKLKIQTALFTDNKTLFVKLKKLGVTI